MEACSPAGGICVMVGWTRKGELSLVSEDILLGKTLKGSYFGGKSNSAFFHIIHAADFGPLKW